jgi:Zn finger protein HypA/HybF involved in hydrogenase expression
MAINNKMRKLHCCDCGKEIWGNPATISGYCPYCNGEHINFETEIKKDKELWKHILNLKKG